MVFLKEFFEKVDFVKISKPHKNTKNYLIYLAEFTTFENNCGKIN